MRIEAIAVSVSIITLLLVLIGVAIRVATRLSVLETQVELLAKFFPPLLDAFSSLSQLRVRHSRETEAIDG